MCTLFKGKLNLKYFPFICKIMIYQVNSFNTDMFRGHSSPRTGGWRERAVLSEGLGFGLCPGNRMNLFYYLNIIRLFYLPENCCDHRMLGAHRKE